jgi:hypothetical protein
MNLTEIDSLDPTDPEEWGLIDYSHQAINLLEGYYGVQEMRRLRLAYGVAGVLGLFVAEVVSRHGKEDVVWVIVGDLPPSASLFEDGDTPRSALHDYADSIEDWADAVDAGEDTAELVPILYQDGTRPVEESPANADLARRRAILIRNVILPKIDD